MDRTKFIFDNYNCAEDSVGSHNRAKPMACSYASKQIPVDSHNRAKAMADYYDCEQDFVDSYGTDKTLAETCNSKVTRGWREPGNMTLQRGGIFGLVLFERRITDQGVGPVWQRQSGARAG